MKISSTATMFLVGAWSRRILSCSTAASAATASTVCRTMSTGEASAEASQGSHHNRTDPSVVKELWILRHGQATHNPRAEKARAEGCSFEDFLELMRQDDSLDSTLTDLGQKQARQVHQRYFSLPSSDNNEATFIPRIHTLVSSPLSRALQTADLAYPLDEPQRLVCEHFREINGWLLNAKRRTRTELQQLFGHWNLEQLAQDHDSTWTKDVLETNESVRQRGLAGLQWILRLPHSPTPLEEQQPHRVLLVAHGGLLRQVMAESTLDELELRDGRTVDDKSSRPVTARMDNAELRRYRLEWAASAQETNKLLLTELDLTLE